MQLFIYVNGNDILHWVCAVHDDVADDDDDDDDDNCNSCGRLLVGSMRAESGGGEVGTGNWSAEGLGPGPTQHGHRQVSVVIEK